MAPIVGLVPSTETVQAVSEAKFQLKLGVSKIWILESAKIVDPTFGTKAK